MEIACTDEVKVYKDEGEEDEQKKSSENLTEDKVGLVIEGEGQCAFDSVNQSVLLNTLAQQGMLQEFVNVIHSLYSHTSGRKSVRFIIDEIMRRTLEGLQNPGDQTVAECHKPRGGQLMTWQKGVKEITKGLSAFGVLRLPGWGPRDPACAWLETLQEMAANRYFGTCESIWRALEMLPYTKQCPFLFNFVIDEIMRRTLEGLQNPDVQITANGNLVDLEYAGDIVLVFEEKAQVFLDELTKVIPSFRMYFAPTEFEIMLVDIQSLNPPLTIQGLQSLTVSSACVPGELGDLWLHYSQKMVLRRSSDAPLNPSSPLLPALTGLHPSLSAFMASPLYDAAIQAAAASAAGSPGSTGSLWGATHPTTSLQQSPQLTPLEATSIAPSSHTFDSIASSQSKSSPAVAAVAAAAAAAALSQSPSPTAAAAFHSELLKAANLYGFKTAGSQRRSETNPTSLAQVSSTLPGSCAGLGTPTTASAFDAFQNSTIPFLENWTEFALKTSPSLYSSAKNDITSDVKPVDSDRFRRVYLIHRIQPTLSTARIATVSGLASLAAVAAAQTPPSSRQRFSTLSGASSPAFSRVVPDSTDFLSSHMSDEMDGENNPLHGDDYHDSKLERPASSPADRLLFPNNGFRTRRELASLDESTTQMDLATSGVSKARADSIPSIWNSNGVNFRFKRNCTPPSKALVGGRTTNVHRGSPFSSSSTCATTGALTVKSDMNKSSAVAVRRINKADSPTSHVTNTTNRHHPPDASNDRLATSSPSSTPNTGSKRVHIKKPLNAFMLFMKDMRPRVQEECTLKESAAINQILGRKWHELPREKQAKYYEMARKEKELHLQLFPGWSARDNYAMHSRRKKKRRMAALAAAQSGQRHVINKSSSLSGDYGSAMDQTDDHLRGSQSALPGSTNLSDLGSAKKCRARFGLEHQHRWCKPCRRKKKCIRFMTDAEFEESEYHSSTPPPSLSGLPTSTAAVAASLNTLNGTPIATSVFGQTSVAHRSTVTPVTSTQRGTQPATTDQRRLSASDADLWASYVPNLQAASFGHHEGSIPVLSCQTTGRQSASGNVLPRLTPSESDRYSPIIGLDTDTGHNLSGPPLLRPQPRHEQHTGVDFSDSMTSNHRFGEPTDRVTSFMADLHRRLTTGMIRSSTSPTNPITGGHAKDGGGGGGGKPSSTLSSSHLVSTTPFTLSHCG
ncbi:hypothetical protein CSKR_104370 [Clonorchis sinensis]|uniref:HMG box domain-containing protein n=1 Tax=Clonorchis sinensis TaxID=79923 RepID=A0A8T1N0R9_CLOSI|nr:hypothetical protein CSKR_104370 [Clonorchis sinensis]